jgi:hypothetical protein
VWTVYSWQLALFLQNIKHGCKGLNVQTTTNAQLQRFLELASIDDFVHILTQDLLYQVFRILGMKDVAFADVLQAFFYTTFSL